MIVSNNIFLLPGSEGGGSRKDPYIKGPVDVINCFTQDWLLKINN